MPIDILWDLGRCGRVMANIPYSVFPLQQLRKPHSLPHPRTLDRNSTKSLRTKRLSFHTSPSLNKSSCENVLASEWYCVNVKHIALEMSQDGTFANF